LLLPRGDGVGHTVQGMSVPRIAVEESKLVRVLGEPYPRY
jgi:hypothetical protein